jgi:hypothetical protein
MTGRNTRRDARHDSRRGNFGIQARSVSAGALAVGDGASATQTVHAEIDPARLAAALDDLQAALARSALPESARAPLREETAAIAAEAAKPAPDRASLESRMRGLIEKLTLVRELIGGAADLIEPVGRLAAALGLGALTAGLL